MSDSIHQRIQEILKHPENMGELANADAVGTVGNSECGEMLRLWIKYKNDRGKKVIDRATFQSFGCETAIAVASLATELIRGKTAEEALALKSEDLAEQLGPLPPMKIHCAELVEGALRSALQDSPDRADPDSPSEASSPEVSPPLTSQFNKARQHQPGVRVVLLDEEAQKKS